MKDLSVLVVDDEFKITEAVAAYLIAKGCTVFTAETGGDALRVFGERNIDIVILDLMLPDVPGEEVCAEIRRRSGVPVIMLTAKSDEDSILTGLAIGADDYIVKPFSLKELYARMEAVLRRTSERVKSAKAIYRNGDLLVDFQSMQLKKGGKEVYLTASEWKILAAFVKCPQTVFTRDKLIEIVFGDDFDSFDRVIDTHIKNLRKKIETDTKKPVYILTVRGRGYKFGGVQ